MEKTYSTPTSLLTAEQHAIVAHQIEPGETLVANAFAGCGKTSTVVARIERRPLLSAAGSGKPVLYVAFNTTTQQEMERRVAHLPTIVQARTYHSLALRFLRHSTSSPVQIGVKPAGLSLYSSAAARILRRYWKDAGNDGWRDEPQQSHLSGRDSLADLAEARRIWSEMLGGNSRNYAWTHDATLKFFCLRAEQSEMWIMSQFSELIVDEAQDVQAVFLHWLMRLKHVPLLLVGDAYQSIYSFTGANNAIQNAIACGKRGTKNVVTLHLTRSFRFGNKIAACATMLLHRASLLSSTVSITGTSNLSGAVFSSHRVDPLTLSPGPVTCIARANATIFDLAMQAVQAGRVIRFVGKSHELMREIDELLKKYPSTAQVNARIRLLTSKSDIGDDSRASASSISSAAEASREPFTDADRDELEKLQMISNAGFHHISRALAKMKSQARKRKRDPNEITFCTVHAAKGLEYDRVFMCDDFPCLQRLIWGIEQSKLGEGQREYYADRFPYAASCSCFGQQCRWKHAARLLLEAGLIVDKPEQVHLRRERDEEEQEDEGKEATRYGTEEGEEVETEEVEEGEKEEILAIGRAAAGTRSGESARQRDVLEKIVEELHVVYVAMTRAKRVLYANCSLSRVIQQLLGEEQSSSSANSSSTASSARSSSANSSSTAYSARSSSCVSAPFFAPRKVAKLLEKSAPTNSSNSRESATKGEGKVEKQEEEDIVDLTEE